MAKSKWETHVLPQMDKITKWAAAGATAKEIAGKLGVAYSTFQRYLERGRKGEAPYGELAGAFARACEEPDDKVEAALFKRCCGYTAEDITFEEKLDRLGNIHTLEKRVLRQIPPDPTSMMFWLTNRRPQAWAYKPAAADTEAAAQSGVVMMPEVAADDGAE